MKGLTGGTLPAKIWADYMRIANMNKEQAFPFPKYELNAKEFDNQAEITEEVVETEEELPTFLQ